MKPIKSPMKRLLRANRLFAYVLLIYSISILFLTSIPHRFNRELSDVIGILYLGFLGVLIALIVILLIVAHRGSYRSKTRLFETGDYVEEAINKGVRYAWIASFLIMSLIPNLLMVMNISIPYRIHEAMYLWLLAVHIGVPAAVYLLLTREDRRQTV